MLNKLIDKIEKSMGKVEGRFFEGEVVKYEELRNEKNIMQQVYTVKTRNGNTKLMFNIVPSLKIGEYVGMKLYTPRTQIPDTLSPHSVEKLYFR